MELDKGRAYGIPFERPLSSPPHADTSTTTRRWRSTSRPTRLLFDAPPCTPHSARRVLNAHDPITRRNLAEAARQAEGGLHYGIGIGDFAPHRTPSRPAAPAIAGNTPPDPPTSPRTLQAKSTSSTCSPHSPPLTPAAFPRSACVFRSAAYASARAFPAGGRRPAFHGDRGLTRTPTTPFAILHCPCAPTGCKIRWPLHTLFGCGGDRDRTKRPKMGYAAGEGEATWWSPQRQSALRRSPRQLLKDRARAQSQRAFHFTIPSPIPAAIISPWAQPGTTTLSCSPAGATRGADPRDRTIPLTTPSWHSPRCAIWGTVAVHEVDTRRSGHRTGAVLETPASIAKRARLSPPATPLTRAPLHQAISSRRREGPSAPRLEREPCRRGPSPRSPLPDAALAVPLLATTPQLPPIVRSPAEQQ